MRVFAAALAAALLPAACGGESAPLKGPLAYRTTVFVDIIPDPQEGCGKKPPESTEWVSPTTGSFRSEGADCSGSHYLRIYSNGRYSSALEGQPTSVRIGSRAFIGSNADESASLQVIASAGDPQVGDVFKWTSANGLPYSVTVEELIPLAEAQRQGLFDVQVDKTDFIDRQLEPGAQPTLPVKAYWFGPTVAEREAFTAVDHGGEDLVHVTFYGDPSEIAAGRTHAYPARELPQREVQVTSTPIDHPLARKTLRAFNGKNGDLVVPPLPRAEIRLKDGEGATVFPTIGEGDAFAVVTRTTLVSVSGIWGEGARKLAPLLRPL
jgi:hypothetical protein